jgi:hypothetical protein
VKIEKHIPVPPKQTGHSSRPSKYPFDEMVIGDSVFVPAILIKGARTAASTLAKKHGWKFTTRKLEEGGQKGVRIWRVT